MRLFGFDINIARAQPPQLEERAADCGPKRPSEEIWDDIGPRSRAGIAVTTRTALSVPGVWAAVKTISETLASLPFGVYERTDMGSRLMTNHPVQSLVSLEPSERYSAFDFRRALFLQACFGNAYARIYRGGTGRPVKLELITDATVTPSINEKNGAMYYAVQHTNGKAEILFPYEVLHIKGLTLDGMTGMSVSHVHRESIGLAVAANEWGGAFFGNGAHMGGFIKYQGTLTKDEETRLRTRFNRDATGVGNVARWKVLDAGMEAEPNELDPEKTMLNETRNFQVNETARIFGIPAHLLQQLDRATFNNIETMNTQFVTLCLRPWAVQMEQEFARKLLSQNEKASGNYFFRMNLDGLLRGDTKSRSAYYTGMFNIGALSPNDIRELENLNKREGGDEYFVPLNMVSSEEPDAPDAETDDETAPEPEAQTDTQ